MGQGMSDYTSSSSDLQNSFPEAPEVLYRGPDREPLLIRKRQTLDQIIQNEIVG